MTELFCDGASVRPESETNAVSGARKRVYQVAAQLPTKVELMGANQLSERPRLKFGYKLVDEMLAGGLQLGRVSEWGMPVATGVRQLFVELLRRASLQVGERPLLWVLGWPGIEVFAANWTRLGVDLTRVLFARSFQPLKELRDVFLEPVFRLIILDTPKPLSRQDFAFLSHQAAKFSFHVAIFQSCLLSPEKGNVWAKVRVNVHSDLLRGLRLEAVRGGGAIQTCFVDCFSSHCLSESS